VEGVAINDDDNEDDDIDEYDNITKMQNLKTRRKTFENTTIRAN